MERQIYTRQRDEELRYQSGDTPCPMTYDVDSSMPGTALTMPGAPTKISLVQYQVRESEEKSAEQKDREHQECKESELKHQQEELQFHQEEVYCLRWEQEGLQREQECLCTKQDANNRILAAQVTQTLAFSSHMPK